MKKNLGILLGAALFMGNIGQACADWDDDRFLCEGTVSYDGKTYAVTEADDTEAEAKRELIEEACEQACRGALFEDACELKCEKNAQLSGVKCSERSNVNPPAAPVR